jgi:hypothetical protein
MGLKKRIGRPPNPEAPPTPALWESPGIDKPVDEILAALEVPKIDAETRGIFQRMLYRQRYFGGDAKGKIILTIRCILESNGNESALIEPIVRAVSSCLTPELTDRGLQLIEAFDQIPLVSLLESMRGLDLFSEKSIGHYYGIALRNKLAKILKPSALTKPIKVKPVPKPPRSVTRIPEIEKNIALGNELLALRAATPSNTRFGRELRARFDVDQKTASQAMRVARLYATRSEIYRAVSWRTLLELSSPKMSPAVRRALEAKVLAGQSITALQIRRARGRLRGGSPKRRPAEMPAPTIKPQPEMAA